MNFSILSDFHKEWQDILVIGKTIERDGRKYHIVGMTLSDEASLYIIEPYDKREPGNKTGKFPFPFNALKTQSGNRNARSCAERLRDTDASLPGHCPNPCGAISVYRENKCVDGNRFYSRLLILVPIP